MEEINEQLGDTEELSPELLSQCKYLRYVLNETLRLRPPAPVRGRTLIEDDEILGHKLKKGAHITYVHLLQRKIIFSFTSYWF